MVTDLPALIVAIEAAQAQHALVSQQAFELQELLQKSSDAVYELKQQFTALVTPYTVTPRK